MDRKMDDHMKAHFHADRIFRVNDVWYYLTRGGRNVGPFATKELARKDLARYVAQIEHAADPKSCNA